MMKATTTNLLLAIGLASVSGAAPDADRPPNIVFILADDLGYGDLGCYGQQKIRTPNLDRMAGEGMRFTQFYAGSTVCAPSRCVLMTGRHTGHCWVRGNGGAEAQTLRDEDVTVAEVLRERGYATALCGKWGLGELGSPGHPNRQGFDHFFGYLNQHHAHNYYPTFLVRDGEKVPLGNDEDPRWVELREKSKRATPEGGGFSANRAAYSHDLIVDDALAWVGTVRDRPFFLYLALTIPHANNERTRVAGDGQEVPDYGPYADLDWTDPNKGQAAMITRMDRDVGRLLDRLEDLDLDERTIVLFSSDNGHHREGGNDPDFFDANGPLRGMKRDLYEGGIRVPLIVRWPGRIAAGSTSDHVAGFADFLATAADLAGAEAATAAPGSGDSLSFVPTLLGRGDQATHEALYWEFYEQGSRQAVRFGDWKAIRQPMFDGTIELYDLSEDLGERRDVAANHPEIVARAARLMEAAHVENPNWKPRGTTPRRPSTP